MSGLWPWLAVAGVGALHGLNPATGWALVAAGGARSRRRAPTWRTLVALALAAVALHIAALLATTAAMAALARLGWRAMTFRPARAAVRRGVEAAFVSVPRPCAAHPPAMVPRVDRSPPSRRSPDSGGY